MSCHTVSKVRSETYLVLDDTVTFNRRRLKIIPPTHSVWKWSRRELDRSLGRPQLSEKGQNFSWPQNFQRATEGACVAKVSLATRCFLPLPGTSRECLKWPMLQKYRWPLMFSARPQNFPESDWRSLRSQGLRLAALCWKTPPHKIDQLSRKPCDRKI